MNMRRMLFPAVIVMSAFILASCAAIPESRTVITGTWKDDAYNKKLSTFLVISLADEPGIRVKVENTIVQRLGMEGLRAEASSDLMPVEQKIDRENVRAAMAGKGFEAVLVSRLLGVESEATYVPPSAETTFDSFFGAQGPMLSPYPQSVITTTPGYTQHRSVVSLQIDLYEAEQRHLIWSLKSQTFNPGNVTEVIDKLAEAIVSDLKAKGLI